MTHEQLVLKVMDLVQIGDVLLVFGAIVWNDDTELDEINKRKGELAHIESDPTCCFKESNTYTGAYLGSCCLSLKGSSCCLDVLAFV